MALSRTVVFKAGSFPAEVTREDIAEAFYSEFHDVYAVNAVQIVPGGVVKVTFGSPDAKKALCSHPTKMIGSIECQVLNFRLHSTFVQVHHYPVEADDGELYDFLDDFGEIVGIRLQHWVGLPLVCTGTRLVEIKLDKDIPRTCILGKHVLRSGIRTSPWNVTSVRETTKFLIAIYMVNVSGVRKKAISLGTVVKHGAP